MKKFITLVCILLCVAFCFAGCGQTTEETAYNKKDLNEALDAKIDEAFGRALEKKPLNVAVDEKCAKDAVDSWEETKIICGEPEEIIGEPTYTYSSGEITGTAKVKCSKKNVIVNTLYEFDAENDNKLTMTSMSFEPEYKTGEKLMQAGSNTIIGMGTVFLVLIFICLVISSFNVVSKINNRRKSKANNNAVQIDTERYYEDVKADLDASEIVAVISAAIAASENQSTDSFVVKSIKRR